jgi:hypothetical protein
MANNPLKLEVKVSKGFDDLRLGFLEASNPRVYRRAESIATLNAARTLQPKIKSEAPKGKTGNLKRNVRARGVRWGKPGAVVGVKGGKQGAFYNWFVVAGRDDTRQTKNGIVRVEPVRPNRFVDRVVEKANNLQDAINAYSKTITKFLNDGVFRGTAVNFKKGRR